MNLGEKIKYYRKKVDMTQAELAEILQVSFQAVSSWERGQYMPDMEKLLQIATVLHVSVASLVEDLENSFGGWELHDSMFSEKHMYEYIQAAATERNLSQTAVVLPLAERLHQGQTCKVKEQVPYIYHPLMMACQALALKLNEDDIIATALLHDVCEECAVKPEELPVNEKVQESIALLTFKCNEGETEEKAKERYYYNISENRLASIVKVLERCNNISTMEIGLERDKMEEYVSETEAYVLPILECIKEKYPEYYDVVFLLKYQMLSLLESLKRIII